MQGKIISGSASGKTTFVERLKRDPSLWDKVEIMGMDNFYKGLPQGINPDNYDFDHPKSLDIDALYECL